MAIKRRKNQLPDFDTDYNQTSDLHPTRDVDQQTNWFLRPITYEIIDEAVFNYFDQRFTIAAKAMPLINLDSDITTQRQRHYQQHDKLKEFLNPPFLTMWRSGTGAMPGLRVSPMNRATSIYTIPEQRPNGIVYVQYITPPPRWETLSYELTFVSTYRERTNAFEEQMNELFKNKRIVIVIDTGERFEMRIANGDQRGELERTHPSNNELQSLYFVKYSLELWAYLRDPDNVKKREKKNAVSIDIVETTEQLDSKRIGQINQITTRLIDSEPNELFDK